MTAYIQRMAGQIPDDWVFSAMLGFKNKGWTIKYFEEEDCIGCLPLKDDIVIVGYIETTIKYFELYNIPVPKPLNIPESLRTPLFLGSGRVIGETTVGDIKGGLQLPIFIKPADRVKQFCSGLLENQKLVPYILNDAPDSAKAMTSTPMNFISEWRCFVHKGELVGMHHYSGDFMFTPETRLIKFMVEQYKDAPVAYTLDVGVYESTYTTSCGNVIKGHATALVECNDMWSVGHYGLRADTYATLLRDRWFEIMKTRVERPHIPLKAKVVTS